MTLPPIAVVRPIRIILEDSDNPLSVKLDASSSLSRGGGALSYSWDLEPTLISIQSDDLTSSSLIVQAPSGASDYKTLITLHVSDNEGLSDSFTIPVESLGQNIPRKVGWNAFFKRRISFLSLRDNPALINKTICMSL